MLEALKGHKTLNELASKYLTMGYTSYAALTVDRSYGESFSPR
jgi:hypothetical protein